MRSLMRGVLLVGLLVLPVAWAQGQSEPTVKQQVQQVGESVDRTQQDYRAADQALGAGGTAKRAPPPAGKPGQRVLTPEEEPLLQLPFLDGDTSRVMLFAMPWFVLFLLSLIRFAGLASGSLTDGVSKAGAVGLALGIPAIVLTLVGFFANFLYILLLASDFKDLPSDVRTLAGQAVDWLRPWADFLSLFWPEAARWFDTGRAHWAILWLTAVCVVLAELCFLVIAVVRGVGMRGKSYEILDRLEKQQASLMKKADW